MTAYLHAAADRTQIATIIIFVKSPDAIGIGSRSVLQSA